MTHFGGSFAKLRSCGHTDRLTRYMTNPMQYVQQHPPYLLINKVSQSTVRHLALSEDHRLFSEHQVTRDLPTSHPYFLP